MKSAVKAYVDACTVCQENKSQAVSLAGLLQRLSIPDRIWEDITMDFIEGLPKSSSRNSNFVVVNRLSKYDHFIPIRHSYSAKDIANIFVK